MCAEEKEEYDVTGGKAYTKSCEALGIIPATYFLRTIQAKEPNISMSHHGIGPKGAKAIAVALAVSVLKFIEICLHVQARLTYIKFMFYFFFFSVYLK